MKFFDCNCAIGKTAVMNPLTDGSVGSLKKVMKELNIQQVLAYHRTAQDVSCQMGNKEIMKLAKEHKEIQPMWVIMPSHTGEFDEPEKCLTSLKEEKIKAVRMFPDAGAQNFSIKEYSMGSWYDVLESQKIPLFTELEPIGWDGVDELMTQRPKLSLVLCNIGYRCDRFLYPLMKKHPNLYIETSRYFPHQGIESLIKEVGHERILFGSGMFAYSAGAGVYHIENLMTDQNIKEDIAKNNLERLLEEVAYV